MIEFLSANSLYRSLALIGLFVLVVFGSYLVATIGARRVRFMRKLDEIGENADVFFKGSLTVDERPSVLARLTKRIEDGGLDLSDAGNSELRNKLRAAGFVSAAAPRIYTFIRIILIFVLPSVYLLISNFAAEPPSLLRIYVVCSLLAVIGLYLPNLFIRAKADRRQTELINGFPDSLDLMLVCVEAGLGLEAALDRVGREMAVTHPLIAEVMMKTTMLMRAGSSREDALRKMGDQGGADQIKSFATLLIQSDKLGTSMAATLRVYSAEMREDRRMRAEEKAHRLPVLISIPLVCFMLPTMIGVLALPAITLAIRDLFPAFSGG